MNQLLIYSERQSNRLLYIAKLLSDRWGALVSVTTDDSVLHAIDVPVYNYSTKNAEGRFNTTPNPLLFQKRIQDQELSVQKKTGVTYLFSNNDSFLGYDPLAAIFYLLSRYEEYLPHRKDEHDRFTSHSSILFEIDCVKTPLVDIYMEEMRVAFAEKYPQLTLKTGSFETEFTFDVDQLFLYDSKGIAKSILGVTKDLIVDRKSLVKRIDVTLGGARDPLNIYSTIQDLVSSVHCTPRFFFQVGESSRFDHNNPVHLPMVRNLIHEISLKADIGLHPSYFTTDNQERLINEHDRLKRITNQEVEHSRQHYLRFNLPNTYRWLESIGVTHDYSMGFSDINGFRASTAYPFRFYDLGREESLRLTVHPFIFMDLLAIREGSIEACFEEIDSLYDTISNTGGVFSTTWHPEALIGFDVPKASMPLLQYCVQKMNGETIK